MRGNRVQIRFQSFTIPIVHNQGVMYLRCPNYHDFSRIIMTFSITLTGILGILQNTLYESKYTALTKLDSCFYQYLVKIIH